MITKILQQRFGRNSDFAKKHLKTFDDLQRTRNYFSAVLLGIARKWFGSDEFLHCEELAISRTFQGKAFHEKESVFQEIPEPREIADHFGSFYIRLIPGEMRQAWGEFYTPDWLAEKLLNIALLPDSENNENNEKKNLKNHANFSVFDPACGSGVFLLAALKHRLNQLQRFGDLKRIATSFVGFDKNPTAVLATRLNIASALVFGRNSRKNAEKQQIPHFPIYLADSLSNVIADSSQNHHEFKNHNHEFKNHNHEFKNHNHEPRPVVAEKFSLILGNPPWINWDRLSQREREELRNLWNEYGLFNLSGKEARYGGAKKEFASLFLLCNADRFLTDGGRIAMVVPRSLFQTIRSGTGFRRFEIVSKNVPLKVLRVDDFSAVNVFSGVSTKTATIVLKKGETTKYPIAYHLWKNRTQSLYATATPSDTADPLSPWKIETKASNSKGVRKTTEKQFVKEQNYRAYLGANTGGANGVFWLEILEPRPNGSIFVRNCPEFGKRKVPQVEFEIESALVYPLLRWKDVDRFKIRSPSLAILLPQDVDRRIGIAEETLRSLYPKTWNYLRLFETELRDRAAFRKYFRCDDEKTPFYSMYNVGPQTLAPIKVVWRRMDSKLRAALVEPMRHLILGERPIVPQETTVILPCETRDQGKRFVAILNSPETEAKIAALSIAGTKGFGSPGILQYLDLF